MTRLNKMVSLLLALCLVLTAISAWTDDEYNAAKQAIIDEYCNVDMRLYADFFDSLSQGTIALKSEEPILPSSCIVS